jgi:hypothetical protein
MSENTPTPAATPRPRRVRTRAFDAGEPQTPAGARQAAAADAVGQRRPTDEELDLRDQMKTGPRRLAGPPLEGDHPEAAPLAALDAVSLSEPTDPTD